MHPVHGWHSCRYNPSSALEGNKIEEKWTRIPALFKTTYIIELISIIYLFLIMQPQEIKADQEDAIYWEEIYHKQ